MVMDASAAVEILLNTPAGGRLLQRVRNGATVAAPHLIDVEIAHVLRRLVRREVMTAARAAAALTLWSGLRIKRYRHDALLERIWSLRENLSAYDAAYVALAEALGLPLVTADRRLARAAGNRIPVEAP